MNEIHRELKVLHSRKRPHSGASFEPGVLLNLSCPGHLPQLFNREHGIPASNSGPMDRWKPSLGVADAERTKERAPSFREPPRERSKLCSRQYLHSAVKPVMSLSHTKPPMKSYQILKHTTVPSGVAHYDLLYNSRKQLNPHDWCRDRDCIINKDGNLDVPRYLTSPTSNILDGPYSTVGLMEVESNGIRDWTSITSGLTYLLPRVSWSS